MKPTILCADDEYGIREYLRRELIAEGYNVVVTADGIEVLDLLDTLNADLVIVDEHMPRCSGSEAARHIKLLNPQLPVILLTGDADYEGYRSASVNRTIIKSEDLEELKDSIASLLSLDVNVRPDSCAAPA